MLPPCLPLVGYLCLVGSGGIPPSINIVPSLLYQTAELRSGEIGSQWRAQIYLRTDVFGITTLPYNPNAAREACSDGTCVKYHRKCDNAVAPKSCDFTIIGRHNPIHVEADSEQDLARAMNALGVIVNTNGDTVRLSAMSVESSEAEAYCRTQRGLPIDPACVAAPYIGP